MELSQIPTAYIMLAARTNSEWDVCDYAIVHITDEWKATMRQRMEAALQFKDDYQFAGIRYYDSPEGFYHFKDDEDWASFTQAPDKDWCFITIEEDEMTNLPVPENRLDTYMVRIFNNGTAQYIAYGKHTGEEFWTSEFNIAEFIGLSVTTQTKNQLQ